MTSVKACTYAASAAARQTIPLAGTYPEHAAHITKAKGHFTLLFAILMAPHF